MPPNSRKNKRSRRGSTFILTSFCYCSHSNKIIFNLHSICDLVYFVGLTLTTVNFIHSGLSLLSLAHLKSYISGAPLKAKQHHWDPQS